MASVNYIFPGVYIKETDLSNYAPRLSSSSLGLVGVASKGPLNTPTRVNNLQQLIDTFGQPPAVGAAKSARQVVTIVPTSPTTAPTGTFTLQLDGVVSGAISVNASAATVQTAVQAMSTVGSGNATVTGSTGGPWTITFAGAKAARPIGKLVPGATSTVGATVTVTVSVYGQEEPTDFSMHAAAMYLENGTQLVFNRVCAKDISTSADLATSATTYPASLAGSVRWAAAANHVVKIQLSAGVSGGTFTIAYNGTVALGVVGSPSSGIAWNASAGTVQTAIEGLAGVGAGQVSVTGGSGIFVVTFIGTLASTAIADLSVSGASLTGGSTPTVVSNVVQRLGRDNSAMQFTAASPGDWGSDLSLQFTLLDGQINEKGLVKYTRTVAATPISGGTFTLAFGGYTTGSIAHGASAATVQTALEGLASIGAGNVLVTGNGSVGTALNYAGEEGYTIEFRGTLAYTDVAFIALTSSLTGGTATYRVYNEGVAPGNNVYRLDVLAPTDVSGNVSVVESFDRVMLCNDAELLNLYNAYFIGDVINTGVRNAIGPSRYVTLDTTTLPTLPSDVKDAVTASTAVKDAVIASTATFEMDGGFSGLDASAPSTGDSTDLTYVLGLTDFDNPKGTDINLLCVSGVTSQSVLAKVVSVAGNRRDCLGVLDTPEGLNLAAATQWHNRSGVYVETGYKPNSSYAAMYWGWFKFYSVYSRAKVWLPPSCGALGVFAYSALIDGPFAAPAGLQRGGVPSALEMEFPTPALGTLEAAYGNGSVLNPLLDFPLYGIHVFGQRTTQRLPTMLDRVNVRMTMLYAEKIIVTATQYLTFDPNDFLTWRRFINTVNPILDEIKRNRGFTQFKIICDETTNLPINLSNNEMIVQILVQPTPTAEKIIVNMAILAPGSSLTSPQFAG